VGFDLDMTLIDPRPGMALAIDELAAATGFAMDGAHFAANLGPPLDVIFREFGVPEERIADLTARFRAGYPDVVIPRTVALPGADEAIDAVRAMGGRVIIVTGKYTRNAELHVEACGWQVDAVIGTLWGPGKGDALREYDAKIYVGDHVSDVLGAKAAGATAIGVTTGPCDEAGLREAGADVIFADLTSFPAWLTANRPVDADA
jgi:phosphoglycolate phosphatase